MPLAQLDLPPELVEQVLLLINEYRDFFALATARRMLSTLSKDPYLVLSVDESIYCPHHRITAERYFNTAAMF